MARRILNRRELRKQADDAEARESAPDSEAADEDDEVEDTDDAKGDEDEESDADTEDGADDEAPRPAKKPAKAKAPARASKARKPKAAPRMRARWGVFDSSMKQVAIFDYNQRAAADEKAAELAAKKNGTFFLQIVKEPMPEPANGDVPGSKTK
jgi:hypothetical protein